MRILLRLSRQYLSCCLALSPSPSLEASRCLTLAAIACLADAVLRADVDDDPSLFALHYAGRAGGPTSAFGFSLCPLESELDQVSIAALSAALSSFASFAFACPRLNSYSLSLLALLSLTR